jgi:hypothetical protein
VALAYVRRVWPPSATVIDFDVAECGPTEANIAETFVFSTTKKQDSLAAVESFFKGRQRLPFLPTETQVHWTDLGWTGYSIELILFRRIPLITPTVHTSIIGHRLQETRLFSVGEVFKYG